MRPQREGYRVSGTPAFPRALGQGKEGGAAHEVDADRTDVAVGPLIVLRRQRTHASAPGDRRAPGRSQVFGKHAGSAHREAQEQTRLADARVADQHENEQVVICGQICAQCSCQRRRRARVNRTGWGGSPSAVAGERGASHCMQGMAMCGGGGGLRGAHSRPSSAPCARSS